MGRDVPLAKERRPARLHYNERLHIRRSVNARQGVSVRLRDYQKRVVLQTLRAWEGHQRLLGVAPTGSGKTIIFSAIAHARQPAGKTLIMAHREELIDQNIDKLYKSTGLIADKEKAEFRARMTSQVVCGSVQSLMGKRRERFAPDHFATIIVDEAHHSLADSYQSVLSYFSGAKVLGVTATPDRGDKKNLGDFFEHVAFEITLPELINSGYLVKPVAKTVPLKIDLRGVRKTAGDFNAGDLEDAISPAARYWFFYLSFRRLNGSQRYAIARGSRLTTYLANARTGRKSSQPTGATSTG
jgi:superfamily II DNA or RNA helicase